MATAIAPPYPGEDLIDYDESPIPPAIATAAANQEDIEMGAASASVTPTLGQPGVVINTTGTTTVNNVVTTGDNALPVATTNIAAPAIEAQSQALPAIAIPPQPLASTAPLAQPPATGIIPALLHATASTHHATHGLGISSPTSPGRGRGRGRGRLVSSASRKQRADAFKATAVGQMLQSGRAKEIAAAQRDAQSIRQEAIELEESNRIKANANRRAAANADPSSWYKHVKERSEIHSSLLEAWRREEIPTPLYEEWYPQWEVADPRPYSEVLRDRRDHRDEWLQYLGYTPTMIVEDRRNMRR